MKKKVMKQVIKRQREQIENLTKILARMTMIARERSAAPMFAESIRKANMGNDDVKSFEFRPIAPAPDHSDILGGAAKPHVTITKDRNKETVSKDIDDSSMHPSRMKSFDLKPNEAMRDFFIQSKAQRHLQVLHHHSRIVS